MLWVPSYIFSNSKPGIPVTTTRIAFATFMAVPGIILTYFVFTADTDSYLWTASAGILVSTRKEQYCVIVLMIAFSNFNLL